MKEFELLGHVYSRNAELPESVTLPPGDDMGALCIHGQEVLVTVDQLADGVHVRLEEASLACVARKAITRNLSDVAAMGAMPCGAVVAASLPRDFGEARALELFNAMRQVGMEYHCPLFGGDISMWAGKLLVSVTVLASMTPGVKPVLRSGSKAGDVICVTGKLGGSLQNVNGYIHHLDFTPRLKVGQTLAGNEYLRPHAMIDLSDGLARDLGHLCDAAKLGAQIDLHHLPVSDGAKQAAAADGKPAWQHALADGEDYELCFTIDPRKLQALGHAIAGVPVTAVGRMTQQPGIVLCEADGSSRPMETAGWEHQGNG